MRRAIREHLRDFIAITLLFVIGLVVTGLILSQQQQPYPSWIPFLGDEQFELTGEFETAQAVIPGQGQTVNMAGVEVGDITEVNLEDGRAIVTMGINEPYEELIHEDATMLLRPRTGLQDMTIELDPGRTGEVVEEGFTVPQAQTEPNVQPDQILASLDADTRDYLQLLIQGGAKGLGGRGKQLSAGFKRFEPLARHLAAIGDALVERRQNIRRSITSFKELSEALAAGDTRLAEFVSSQNAVFESFASQEAGIRATLREFPGALRETRAALASGDRLSAVLGPASRALIPQAQAFVPAQQASQDFFASTVAPIRDQIRPFARQVQRPVRHLKQAADPLAQTIRGLGGSLGGLNNLFNGLSYNPPGSEEGYLFWLAWLNHNTNNIFLTQDAHGPLRRGSCCSRATRRSARRTSPAPGPTSAPCSRSPTSRRRTRSARSTRRSEGSTRDGQARHPDGEELMETRPPSATRILIAVGFAISCFGLALFLWLAFGGAIPLKPEGYRFTVPFDEATQLAQESDVRISGVSVGKVKRVDLSDEGYADATIELDSAYAPIPEDTQAILRQKTLLGETYVELTPGTEGSDTLPEGGDLPPAQVSNSVQLDEIFRAFDGRTRAAFQAWMQGQAAAFRGRGDDLSVAIASLDPFAEQADKSLRLLDSQSAGVSGLVRNAGTVFEALSERQGQLRGLIENSNAVFETTARRNEELATAFTIFPTFLRESRLTLDRLERFAADNDATVVALRPGVRELAPTFSALGRLSPELESFFVGLRRAIDRREGFASLRRLLDDDLPPILGRLDSFLPPLNSILEGIRMYRHEVTAFLGNATAATNGFLELDPQTLEPLHYLRTEAPLGPEVLSTYARRLQINRTNPYVKPKGYLDVTSAIKSFETRQCTGGVNAVLDPTTPSDPDFNVRTGGDVAAAQDYFDRILFYAFNDVLSSNSIAVPACDEQAPFESIGAPEETTDYLHVYPQP